MFACKANELAVLLFSLVQLSVLVFDIKIFLLLSTSAIIKKKRSSEESL